MFVKFLEVRFWWKYFGCRVYFDRLCGLGGSIVDLFRLLVFCCIVFKVRYG